MKKYLWYFLFLLIGMAAVYTTLCYYASNKLDFTISKTIKAPSLMVYNQVNDFGNWDNWSSWATIDTNLHTSINDIRQGKGAEYTWSVKKITGKITIVESTKANDIKTLFTSNKNENRTHGDWTISAMSKQKTKIDVHYYDEDELPFFLRGYRLISGGTYRAKKGIDNDLNNLEEVLLRQYNDNVYRGYQINEIDQEEAHYVIKRGKVKVNEMQQFYSQNLGFLFQSLQKNDVKMKGMPSGLYFQRDITHDQVDMAAGIPVEEQLAFEDISSYTIPESKAIEVDYYGDYKDINKAHLAIQSYMADHNTFNNPPILETYVTDPSTVKDMSKWLTKVRYLYNE